MSSLSDATRAPIPYDLTEQAALTADWGDQPDNVAALIINTACCSPYLAGLIAREGEWLRDNLQTDLDRLIADTLAAITGEDFDSLSASLRTAKRRVALLAALADLGDVWSLEQVTGALTDLADRAVQAAMQHLVMAEVNRGKLPDWIAEAPEECGGLVALAMGKMGAGELNYSSDIDLIMLFDETRYPEEDFAATRSAFIRVTQRLVKLLSEPTAEGYVFRTDLRLRPDPSVTPVCIAMDAAERYYESFGRTWERAAFIKARPCAGDIVAGDRFLTELRPFIWRKHLDFAAIQDAHDMRLRIREHKQLHGPITFSGHDLKLGRGGIREIEFFTQTRQIICGGREPAIRNRETVPALAALAGTGWITDDLADNLTRSYRQLREWEHRIQMLDDMQTHKLPDQPDKQDRFARFCGYADTTVLSNEIIALLKNVHERTEAFFAPDDTEQNPDLPEDFLSRAKEFTDRWHQYPALRSERAERIFSRIENDLLSHMANASDPDFALSQFDAFLSDLPAGVQIFSLFEANPILLELIADISATAPALAQYMGRNPQVLDAVVTADFFDPLPGLERLQAELHDLLTRSRDYEDTLDITRRWVKEKQFKVGVGLLRGIASPDEAAVEYSDIAEACLGNLFPAVCTEFSRRYGEPPGQGAAVIAMGKLGSREMTATSDLDLIVIYDAEGAEYSDGPKQLPIKTYFARLTQTLLSALTVPTAEGALYQVDMRLRPSGRQGPVATALNSFSRYQYEDAWTWEHLALTRARVLVGSPKLQDGITTAISHALTRERDAGKTLQDLADMRDRLFREKSPDGPLDVKNGEGRMMDLELFLQTGALLTGSLGTTSIRAHVPQLLGAGWIDASEADVIETAHKAYSAVLQITRLTGLEPDASEAMINRVKILSSALSDRPDGMDVVAYLTSLATKMTKIIHKRL